MTGLPAAAVSVVAELGESHVRRLLARYSAEGPYSESAAARACHAVPAGHRHHLAPLNAAWRASVLDGPSVALALETALVARQVSATATVDVVVTGPDSPAAPVRLTSEVLHQLIDSATTRVMIVSFAAHQLPAVVAALDRAVARGVRVDLVLESAENLKGGGGAGAAYTKFRTYIWPADQRPSGASLHAKAVIADGRDVLLTSANMTNAAYDRNIELGVLCRGGTAARRVQLHFDSLIAAGTLRPV